METDERQTKALLELQICDLELLQITKKLEELPQRQRILEIRKRRQAIEEKKEKLDYLRATTDDELVELKTEDALLIEKQDVLQAKIDEVRNDYRAVTANTKALNGVAKRRNTLETEIMQSEEKLSEISTVDKQIEAALNQISAQESAEVAIFQQVGGVLSQTKAELTRQREKMTSILDSELIARYEKKASRCGGVAVSELKGDTCSVCRNKMDIGRLLQVQAERPLSECPQCKRIMVVD